MAIVYTAVIPAYNAAATLDACLAALNAAEPPPDQVVVVDDGSTDETGAIAERHGAEVIRNDGKPMGPARGRNAAAARARNDLILFVDADVVVDADAPRRLLAEMETDDKIAATFGSYGTHQAASNVTARYANLRHHFYHQEGHSEAETFWAGLGAVRRSVFEELGGFDHAIDRPRLEDVELGFRIREHGYRIRLVRDALGTHLKNWTLRRLWREEIQTRAVPWSEMMAAGRCKASLNASSREKALAVLAHLIWLSAALTPVNPGFAMASAAGAVVYIAANWRLLALFRRHGGWPTAVAGVGLHWAYHLYSSVTFALVFARVLARTRLGG